MHYFSFFFQRSHLQVKKYVFKQNVNLFCSTVGLLTQNDGIF